MVGFRKRILRWKKMIENDRIIQFMAIWNNRDCNAASFIIEPYYIIGGLIRPIKLNALNGNCIKPNGSAFNAAAVARMTVFELLLWTTVSNYYEFNGTTNAHLELITWNSVHWSSLYCFVCVMTMLRWMARCAPFSELLINTHRTTVVIKQMINNNTTKNTWKIRNYVRYWRNRFAIHFRKKKQKQIFWCNGHQLIYDTQKEEHTAYEIFSVIPNCFRLFLFQERYEFLGVFYELPKLNNILWCARKMFDRTKN